MLIKEGKPLSFKVFLIAVLVFLANLAFFMLKNRKTLASSLTGNSIKTTFYAIKNTFLQNYSTMSIGLKIFLIAQWVFILTILVYAIYRDSRIKKIKDINIPDLRFQKSLNKNQTDLDTLYDILKEKKELSISFISESFKISYDKALEWCKILESAELIYIDYPGFGEPYIKLLEKNINEEKNKKDNIDNTLERSLIKEEINKSTIKEESKSKETNINIKKDKLKTINPIKKKQINLKNKDYKK